MRSEDPIGRPPAGPGGQLFRRRPLEGLSIATRLALLTAVCAVALVLAGSEIALSWSLRLHLDEDRREAVSVATTLASYLATVAPDGELDSLVAGFQAWARSDISGADAAIYRVVDGRLERIAPARVGPGAPADSLSEAALARRATQVRFRRVPDPAWRVAVPLGERAPYGVLSVTIPTQRLADLAAERRRVYTLAVGSALLVAAAVAWLSGRWVGRPLEALGRAMAQAHGGPGPAPQAPELGPREFRLVARRYNELLHALQARERESQARAALLALEERARGYDRLAVTAETTAELAHEIGTPLSTMRGHIQLLRDDLVAAGQTASVDRINSLLAQLDRVTAIVRAGLERGSWPKPLPGTVDLRELALRLLQFLEPSLQAAQVQAELGRNGSDRGDGRVLAQCDPALVEQILLNLIKNAIEALPPGGHIRLVTGLEPDHAYVIVADDGPGLAPEVRAYLFNPFTTTKGNAGTGLGLVISRRLARVLGGELVYLPSERGTHWKLTLPPAPPGATAGQPSRSDA